jgi:hypothetical protein
VPVITLSTDFGWDDPYAGIMKGVILRINPRAVPMDISHGLSNQRLIEAAFKVAAVADYFPKGTIHLAVVDPGVGSARRPIVVKTKSHFWVGPDNGIFTRIMQTAPGAKIFHLTNPRYFLNPVSATFHGRDIFAPAAAHLSRGLSLPTLGKRISDPLLLNLPDPSCRKDEISGQVLYADRFGNLITNINRKEVERCFPEGNIAVRIGRRKLGGLQETYAQSEPGRLLTLFGSSGFLEIACNRSSAAEMLDYSPGKLPAVRLVRMEAPE